MKSGWNLCELISRRSVGRTWPRLGAYNLTPALGAVAEAGASEAGGRLPQNSFPEMQRDAHPSGVRADVGFRKTLKRLALGLSPESQETDSQLQCPQRQ
jgi:hypothetical protein